MDKLPAIVVPVYRRIASLQRLIASLERAEYPVVPTLHFLIDGGADYEVVEFCSNYSNLKFAIVVTNHEKNLGVDDNVLFALNLSHTYGAVIVLEDDSFVSSQFYNYAVQASEIFSSQPQIAGISLYCYLINQPSGLPFFPLCNGNDFFAYQKVSSRGILITQKQWTVFQQWYQGYSQIDWNEMMIPDYISQWPDACWEKIYNRYLVATNSYLAYPYQSLTTVFGEDGVHVKKLFDENAFQVPLYTGKRKDWRLVEDVLYYDSYSERVVSNNIEFDLYGCKPLHLVKRKQIITSRKVAKFVKSFGRNLKPHELNIDYEIAGSDFFLIDGTDARNSFRKNLFARYREWQYYFPDATMLDLIKFKCVQILKRIFKI